jgi:hypothetical protein
MHISDQAHPPKRMDLETRFLGETEFLHTDGRINIKEKV